MEKKKFTWADLKQSVNEIPEELLDKEVIVWEEEKGCKIISVLALEENYLYTDEGAEPESVIRDNYEGDPKDFDKDHYVIHPKGARILLADI